jgi:hypothetical protein
MQSDKNLPAIYKIPNNTIIKKDNTSHHKNNHQKINEYNLYLNCFSAFMVNRFAQGREAYRSPQTKKGQYINTKI